MKKKYFTIQMSLIFIYVLFFILMDLLFVNIQTSPQNMSTYTSIYSINYYLLPMIVFLNGFF